MAAFSNIDQLDVAILDHLQTNARMTNKALASSVGVSPSTTLERVRLLERRGVITGYHAEVDPAATGGAVQAFVALRFMPKTRDIIEAAVESIWKIPEVTAVHLVSGQDDLLVRVATPDVDTLRQTVMDSISRIDGIVEERTSLLFESRKKHRDLGAVQR